MTYCDFVSSSEVWNNTALTASQIKWASRTWLLSQNITDATTAATLTNTAISKGIDAHYACTSYGVLPSWLASYVSQITSSTPAPTPVSSTVSTGTASNITVSGATLNGALVNMGTSSIVSVRFDWGLTTSYGNTTAASTLTNIGASSAAVTGLTSNTVYHFRVKAIGSSTVYGNDATFKTSTPIVAPTVTTGTASNITVSGATLNGALVDMGTSSIVSVRFDWGLTTSYGNTTAASTLTNIGASSAAVTGLTSNTVYHFRVKAIGSSTVYGNDATFTTTTSTPVSGNTVGTVVGTPVASGEANEYCFNLKITRTSVSGVTVGQQVWCAATTISFPNLLTSGATLTGNLDNSLGWWVIK